MSEIKSVNIDGIKKLVCEQWGLIAQLSKIADEISNDSMSELFSQIKNDLGDESEGIAYKYEQSKNIFFKIRASIELGDIGTIELGYIQVQIGRDNDESLTLWITFMHPLKTLPHHSISDVKTLVSNKLKTADCNWNGFASDNVEHRNTILESKYQPTSDTPVQDLVREGLARVISFTDVFTWLLNSIKQKHQEAKDAIEGNETPNSTQA